MTPEQEQLIMENYGCIVKASQRFISNSPHVSPEDFVQDALAEICDKIDKFDPNMGKFTTFVYVCVRNALIKKVKKIRPLPLMVDTGYEHRVEFDETLPDELSPLEETIIDLRKQGYTMKEMVDETGIDERRIKIIQKACYNRIRNANKT